MDYLDLVEDSNIEKESLSEGVEAYAKLLPALNKIESVFISTFSTSDMGQKYGREYIQGLVKPGLDLIASSVLLAGEEATKADLENFQKELNKFIVSRALPIVNKAKFGKGLQGFANKLKQRMNSNKGFFNKLKGLFKKSDAEKDIRTPTEPLSQDQGNTPAPATNPAQGQGNAPAPGGGTPPPQV